MEFPHILVIGCNGQVGWELLRALMPIGKISSVTRAQMNLLKPNEIHDTLHKLKPNIVINAAAYTNVEDAETDPDLAYKINSNAPEILAKIAHKLNIWLIHYSTDYIFDGQTSTDYRENDAPNPLNQYGGSKLSGEAAIIASGCQYLILRTSWVYGLHGGNFLKSILKSATQSTSINVVNDQYGSPTWSRNLAEATAQIIIHNIYSERTVGIYHITSSGKTTWYHFAKKIIHTYSNFFELKCKHIQSVSSESYKMAAKRPKNSILNNSKLLQDTGIKMPCWQNSLELCLQDLMDCSQLTPTRKRNK